MNIKTFNTFSEAIADVQHNLLNVGYEVLSDWQGSKAGRDMYEIFNHAFSVPVYTSDLDILKEDIKPNLPWADDHFLERICGVALNPGIEWRNWPYAKSANNFRTEGDKFTHTYMERYWPKYANNQGNIPNGGIRYDYGDLDDVMKLLVKEPNTRQAFMPVWFPEDTGVLHGGRVPCSIGYHFLLRHNYLHINYWLRSCDFIRHFRDDIYLTVRLLLFVLWGLSELDEKWKDIKPGFYTQYTTSMHMFDSDYKMLKRR